MESSLQPELILTSALYTASAAPLKRSFACTVSELSPVFG
jgi:hypothetical protein